jgi:hypothetical protein
MKLWRKIMDDADRRLAENPALTRDARCLVTLTVITLT